MTRARHGLAILAALVLALLATSAAGARVHRRRRRPLPDRPAAARCRAPARPAPRQLLAAASGHCPRAKRRRSHMRLRSLATAIALAAALASLGAAAAAAHPRWFPHPLVIGHRGAAGYLPDHTIAGYTMAMKSVPTASSPTWCRPRTVRWSPATSRTHGDDRCLGASRIRGPSENQSHRRRQRDRLVRRRLHPGQIKTLRAIQPMADRLQGDNGKFPIPTLRGGRRSGQTQEPGAGPGDLHLSGDEASDVSPEVGLALERHTGRALQGAG